MSDEIYKPLIDGMKWSYSRIECFSDCRYRWFLKYIKKEEEEEQFYSSYGSFIHRLLESYFKGNISAQDAKTLFLIGFKDNVSQDIPSESIVDKYVKKACEYFDNLKGIDINIVAVEKKIDFNIGGNRFVGVIDLLGEKDGEYYIVDHKSRDLKQRSHRKKPTVKDLELDDMLKQLYIYAEAVKQEFGKYPKYLCFNCFKNGEFIKEEFDIEKCKQALKWAEDAIERIKNVEEFYPSVEFFSCRYICPFYKDCVYWQER